VRRLPPAAALLVALVLAGCGARSSKPFTADASAACFTKKGFTNVTTATAKVGFIAGVAANGGLAARSRAGNALTVAFAADAQDAVVTEGEFRKYAPASLRPHMADIMESKRNAVLVWTVSPSVKDLAAAESCLAS